MPELHDHDTEHLRLLLRDTTDHLRLPARLADSARTGAVRRTRRHRALWAGLGVLTVTMAVTAVAMLPGSGGGPTSAVNGANTPPAAGGALPESCLLQELATPADGPVSIVTGGDPSGRYLLTRARSGAVKRVSIWTGDSPRVVPMTGEDPVLVDVNTAGTAVGSSFAGKTQISWLYRDGALQRLPGDDVGATAINRGDLVVGSRVPGDGLQLPVVWRALDRPAEQLPLPDGAFGNAVDVADDGTIIGVVYPTSGDLGRGYVWLPNGEHRQLPLPTVDGRQAVSYWPTSIHGTVVDGIAGVNVDPGRRAMVPVTFDLTTGAYTIFPKHLALPVGNGRGILAGQADGSAMMSDGWRHLRLDQLAPTTASVVPTTTSGVTSPTPSPSPSAGTPSGHGQVPMVVFISDDARTLAGQAVDVNGLTKAVVWRCR